MAENLTTGGPYSISNRPLNSLELAFTGYQVEATMEEMESLESEIELLKLVQTVLNSKNSGGAPELGKEASFDSTPIPSDMEEPLGLYL